MHTFLLLVVSYLLFSFSHVLYAMDIKPKLYQSRRVPDDRPREDVRELMPSSSASSASDSTPKPISPPRLFSKSKLSSSSHSISPKSSPRSPKASPREQTIDPEDNYKKLKRAVQNNHVKKVVKYLDRFTEDSEMMLNQKLSDMGNNTLFQLAVLRRNKTIVQAFIKHSAVTTLCANEDGRLACQLFDKNEMPIHKELFDIVMTRTSLDLIIRAVLVLNPTLFIKPSEERIHAIIKELKKRLPEGTFLEYATPVFCTNRTFACLRRDAFILQNFINEYANDVNAQDDLGNTMTHYAVYARDIKPIESVIINPCFESSRKNYDGKVAHQLILPTEQENSDSRLLLFARYCVESFVKKETEKFFSPHLIEREGPAITVSLETSIKEIKKNYDEMIKKQKKDRALPEKCLLPEDEFICNMLQHSLEERINMLRDSILKEIVQKETETFLLTSPVSKEMSQYDPAVKTSIENIKKEFKKVIHIQIESESHLSKYIDTVIYNMFQDCITQRKQNQLFSFIEQGGAVIETRPLNPEDAQYL